MTKSYRLKSIELTGQRSVGRFVLNCVYGACDFRWVVDENTKISVDRMDMDHDRFLLWADQSGPAWVLVTPDPNYPGYCSRLDFTEDPS